MDLKRNLSCLHSIKHSSGQKWMQLRLNVLIWITVSGKNSLRALPYRRLVENPPFDIINRNILILLQQVIRSPPPPPFASNNVAGNQCIFVASGNIDLGGEGGGRIEGDKWKL